MKYFVTSLLLFCFNITSAQEEPNIEHLIFTTVFKFEAGTKTQNIVNTFIPKSYKSLGYEMTLDKWSYSTSFEYTAMKIDDDCVCYDHYHGVGYLKEFNLFSGVSYRLVSKSKIQLIVGTDIYYSSVSYSGEFEGGFNGQGISIDKDYDSYGIRQRLGMHFFPIQRLRLSLTTSARLGQTLEKVNHNTNRFKGIESYLSFPELMIGFRL